MRKWILALPAAATVVLVTLGVGLPQSQPAVSAEEPLADPPVVLGNPIMFVTQIPIPQDFATVNAVFANHGASIDISGRYGDLWIRYADGTLKNLTAAAGFNTGPDNAVGVREPHVHWNGQKAIFSMVVGAPTKRYELKTFRWQLYEITGLGKNDTPVITKVPNQPATFNNVSPIYGTDERIIFVTDRPRTGQMHLYPQLDEYESTAIVTGLWSLDPATGDLFQINHSPSGSYTPQIDSYGRVVFSRWDHLIRDQQADADAAGTAQYGSFNYSDETAGAAVLNSRAEVFPEPRINIPGSNLEPLAFNHFFPWQINEDGTDEETLNHVGRHELLGYFNRTQKDDPNVTYFVPSSNRVNKNSLDIILQMREDPKNPGTYLGISCAEFGTHAAGGIVALYGPAGLSADNMSVAHVTHPSTGSFIGDNATPDPNFSGMYRQPLPMLDGTLVAVHSADARQDRNQGTSGDGTTNPLSRYNFRLRTLKKVGEWFVPDKPLTPGISKTIQYWTPDSLLTYSGELWELDPVEVRPRTKPTRRTTPVPAIEQAVFAEEGVDMAAFQTYLKQHNLALVVSRNVTTRDKNDRQQPFNLKVAGTATQTVGASGKIYDIAFLQFFQGDQIRGYRTYGGTDIRPGRRVLAQPLHENLDKNVPAPGGPAGSVKLGADGSMAALVPARRAMSWQLTDGAGTPVVRERFWVSFQAGEIRTCVSCHGLNAKDQAGGNEPTNKPQALRDLLQQWKAGGPPPPTAELKLLNVVSRMSHAGTNHDLDVSGNGVEPRKTAGDLKLRLTFDKNVKVVDGTPGADNFQITGATYASSSINGNVLVLNLAGAANASTIDIVLLGLTDTSSNPLAAGSDEFSLRILRGDVNRDGIVETADRAAVKANRGKGLGQGRFVYDLDRDGVIDDADMQLVTNNLGRSAP